MYLIKLRIAWNAYAPCLLCSSTEVFSRTHIAGKPKASKIEALYILRAVRWWNLWWNKDAIFRVIFKNISRISRRNAFGLIFDWNTFEVLNDSLAKVV